jgi:hypothetical protein
MIVSFLEKSIDFRYLDAFSEEFSYSIDLSKGNKKQKTLHFSMPV